MNRKKYFTLKKLGWLLLLFWLGFFLVKLQAPKGKLLDAPSLVASLREQGLQVKQIFNEADDYETSLFSEKAKHLLVNGFPVLVYEFKTKPQAVEEMKTVSKKGYQIGETMMGWVERPHFYQKGRLIVGYIGKIPIILDVLEKSLGNPLAK